MKKILYILLILLLSLDFAMATHNRAGEITYKRISESEYLYEITIVTYTYTLSAADRNELEVDWGDNSPIYYIKRESKVLLGDNYQRNVYVGEHRFNGIGFYEIVMTDRNRNDGVQNIPGSVNEPFTIKTTFQIHADLGFNDTPILETYPIDKAKVGETFIHNPSASDLEGDSISYKLTECLGENGDVIVGYTYPPASDSIYVNPINGDLIWDTPVTTGIYNVAMLIEEWRDNGNGIKIKISKIVRDIQIEVIESDNHSPNITQVNDLCVEAGTLISFDVVAYDQDNDYIDLTASGTPFLMAFPADFIITTDIPGFSVANFNWQTDCKHVADQHHQLVVKAKDHDNLDNFVDYMSVRMKVVSPAPENLSLSPTNNTMNLTWDACECSNANGYEIYRRENLYGYVPSNCETGVPAYTGYEKVGRSNGFSNTTFLDNDNGEGLKQGYIYCYMVVATFDDGAESYASEEACSPLERGLPLITMVSIDSTSSTDGIIKLDWAKPSKFDTIAGTYQYKIYRSYGFWGNNLSLIATNNGINDTTLTDYNLNTQDSAYSYKIEFYRDGTLIGSPQIASSTFMHLFPSDNKITIDIEKNVPWFNTKYIVYKYNNDSLSYDSIGYTNNTTYVDSMLKNGVEYCYKLKAVGNYFIQDIKYPLINYSQEDCEEPIDTVPPCAPIISLEGDCDLFVNYLDWTNPNNYCANDVVSYNVFYSPTIEGEMEIIETLDLHTDTSFIHSPSISMAGCYYIQAVDSFNNALPPNSRVCIDECTYYNLPNVFTPNGDNINDLYKPGPYMFVEKVDMKIFNRWGTLLFETDNPDILWDGKNQTTNKLVPDGVYYYVCDVYEHRLSGIEPRNIVGFIHVVGGNNESTPQN